MKFFESLRKKNEVSPSQPVEANIELNMVKPGVLNLQKNDILDLTKVAPSLTEVKVGAGWDINAYGKSYDLDLCAMLLDSSGKLIKGHNPCIYFGDMKSRGIYLDGDNMTGEGDGDDETIFVELNKLPTSVERIVFYVVIYKGADRGQYFSKVKNAFVRLVDVSENQEIELCVFNLTENGATSTAVEFCELHKVVDGWEFKAIGNYENMSITQIKNMYR